MLRPIDTVFKTKCFSNNNEQLRMKKYKISKFSHNNSSVFCLNSIKTSYTSSPNNIWSELIWFYFNIVYVHVFIDTIWPRPLPHESGSAPLEKYIECWQRVLVAKNRSKVSSVRTFVVGCQSSEHFYLDPCTINAAPHTFAWTDIEYPAK